MKRRFRAGAISAIIAATIGVATAQTSGKTIRIVGCVQKSGGSYILNDTRARDDRYRLDANAEDLDFHTGHFVEVVGSITDAATNPVRLKVTSFIYISQTCPSGVNK